MHIFFNSIALLSFLSFMENAYGIPRTMIIYLVGGFGGNMFSNWCNKDTPN